MWSPLVFPDGWNGIFAIVKVLKSTHYNAQILHIMTNPKTIGRMVFLLAVQYL
ncbi:hypothetical protein ACI8B_50188 [Acinetobacter proteolyticus]|uniref:Uncharacterized protein n=1 Tax=Acinetobacter proteolyticus TaxID=1776741 RepID=A0A653K9N0_9GAMM|nr:hypothetical protein ACI8B_50188 [Acinetobacter proteolyticus]